jgi:protein SCO1/2
MKWRNSVLIAIGATVLSACDPAPARFDSIDITDAKYAQGFALTDHTGTKRTLADFKGKLVVVFFGFANCPDVCPTTLATLADVKKRLGKDGDKLQAVFITVDPERDTQQVLAQYVPAFDPTFVGLWGTPAEIEATARQFKVFYEKVPGKTPTSYTMNHTAGSYVFDTQGRIRLFLKHEQSAESIASDLKKLLG